MVYKRYILCKRIKSELYYWLRVLNTNKYEFYYAFNCNLTIIALQ